MVPTCRNNQSWLPDVFNDLFDRNWMERASATAPAINVMENENGYELELAAPGMTKEDFKVRLNDNGDLVIDMDHKTNKEEKKDGRYLRREFHYGKFEQTMLLPDDAEREQISAKVENGILTVEIPKVKKVHVDEEKKFIEVK